MEAYVKLHEASEIKESLSLTRSIVNSLSDELLRLIIRTEDEGYMCSLQDLHCEIEGRYEALIGKLDLINKSLHFLYEAEEENKQ